MRNFFSKTLNRGLAVLMALVLAVSGIPVIAVAENENPSDDYTYGTSGVTVSGTEDEDSPQEDNPSDPSDPSGEGEESAPSDESGGSGQEADFTDGEAATSGVIQGENDAEDEKEAASAGAAAFNGDENRTLYFNSADGKFYASELYDDADAYDLPSGIIISANEIDVSGASWDGSTLTLNNVSLITSAPYALFINNDQAITLELKGSNTLISTNTGTGPYHSAGVLSINGLTITGSGSLTATGGQVHSGNKDGAATRSTGIFNLYGALIIENGIINATGGTGYISTGLFGGFGTLSLNGGVVTAEGTNGVSESNGVSSDAGITMNGGSLITKGGTASNGSSSGFFTWGGTIALNGGIFIASGERQAIMLAAGGTMQFGVSAYNWWHSTNQDGSNAVYDSVSFANNSAYKYIRLDVPTAGSSPAEITDLNATDNGDDSTTVGFTSDKEGAVYYKVQDSGEPEPDKPNHSGDGWIYLGYAQDNENSFDITGVPSDDKDIYIVVADDDYNVSDPVKVPARDLPPTYGISLTPGSDKAFGTAIYGYGAQTAHSVTVTNTGNQPTGALAVVLSGMNNGSFTLSKASIASIAVSGSDSFTVVPKTGLAVGTHTATVTVSGSNGISESFGVSFEVTKANQAAFTITNPGTKTYGDADFNLALSASGSGTGAVTYQSNNTSVVTVSGSTVTIIGAGNAGITATKAADGNFNTATDTVAFTVNKAALTPSISFGGVLDREYNGTTNITGAAISLSGAVLSETPAASASFAFTNKDVGTNKTVNATGITLTGTWGNNYALSATSLSGIASGKAIIAAPLAITGFSISKVYDGDSGVKGGFGTPLFSGLKNGETATVNTTGVTSTYNNANVGTDKAITFGGSLFGMTGGNAIASNYTITQPAGVTGEITAKALTWSNGSVSDKTYDGTDTATISAAPALTGVVSGDGDTITVTAGTAKFASANAGNQTVTATGWSGGGTPLGNYTFPVSQPGFANATINKKPLEDSMVAAISNRTYTGSAIEPSVTVTDGSPSIITAADYAVSYSDNQNTGTATVTVTATAGGNYSGTATKSFIIDKANNNLVITCASISFGGTADPQVTTNTSGGAVSYEYKTTGADDSTYSSAVPTVVGDYTVRATSAATANYNSATATADFSIGKETPTVNWPDGLTAAYGQTLADVALPANNGTGTAGSFSWTASTTLVGNAGTQQHSLTFTPDDSTNYNITTSSVDVEVSARDISNADVGVISNQIYTGSAIQPVLSVSDSGAAITSSDYDISYHDNISVGTAKVTLTGKGNYTGTKTNAATFNIAAAALGNRPTISGAVRIGETLTAVTTPLNAHGDSGTTFAYQWNAGGVDVDGATNSTYEIQGSDVGKTIMVTVTATGNYEGPVTSEQVTVPYKVIVTAYDSDGDSVTANEDYQNAGTAVAVEYTLTGTHIKNKLALSAGSNTIKTIETPVSTPVTASYDYIVTAAHADTNGVITITAAFNHTNVLSGANINITAPVKAAEPQDATTAESDYTITDTVWNGNLTQDDKFAGGEPYSVTITLSATDIATFADSFTPEVSSGTLVSGSVNITDGGTKVTFTVTYPALPAKTVSSISVTTQPELTYVTGDKLDLSALRAEVTYDDDSTENIGYNAAGLTYKIVSDSVTNGTTSMSYSKHDGEKIAVSYGGRNADTDSLTVYETTTLKIAVSDIDSTSAKLIWSATTDSRNTITSKLQVKSGGVWTDVAGASPPYTASGLSPNTSYEYRIWVRNNATSRVYGRPIAFRTAESAPSGITVSGTVIDNSSPPLASITVTIEHGNTVIASDTITGGGTYNFSFSNIPDGVYNLVSDNGSYKVTQAVTVSGVDVTDIRIDMASGKTQSIIEIVSGAPSAAVDGLPKLFTLQDEDFVQTNPGAMVEIKLTVNKRDAPADAGEIEKAAAGQTVGLYLDLSVLKSRFDALGDLLSETPLTNLGSNLITITFDLPDNLKGKSNLTIYRVHNNAAEALTPTPNAYNETAEIDGDLVTLNVCRFSTYAIAYTPDNPNPPKSSSSNGGSSTGGGGGGTGAATGSTYWIEAPDAKALAKSAKEQGAEIARSRRATITGIRKASLRLLSESGLRYQHDTAAGNTVQVRVYVDEPAAATKDVLVSGYTAGNTVDKTTLIINKWFSNNVAVISLDQQGDFGMNVRIAARVDLSGMNKSKLYFYSYDKATNKYNLIVTEYRLDSKGYIHFSTVLGGSIIVTDRPLTKIGADAEEGSDIYEPQITGGGLDNPTTGGDGTGMYIPPAKAQEQDFITAQTIIETIAADGVLKLESKKIPAANIGAGGTIADAAVFNLDAPAETASGTKPKAWPITGSGVLILLAAAILWAVIPRKDDVLVQNNERRL